jgi:hypothetical protein
MKRTVVCPKYLETAFLRSFKIREGFDPWRNYIQPSLLRVVKYNSFSNCVFPVMSRGRMVVKLSFNCSSL